MCPALYCTCTCTFYRLLTNFVFSARSLLTEAASEHFASLVAAIVLSFVCISVLFLILYINSGGARP